MKTSDWISVSDRLPDDGFDKIVFNDEFNNYAIAYFYDGCWIGECDIELEFEPTNWMDLPTAPKTE